MPVTGVALYAMQNGLSMRPQVAQLPPHGRGRGRLAPHARRRRGCAGGWSRWSGCGRCCTGCGRWRWSSAPSPRSGWRSTAAPRRRPAVGRRHVGLRASPPPLTPVGPSLYGAVVQVGSRTAYFAEWLPPDWVSWPSAGFAVLLAATLVGLWLRGHNSWTETLLIVLAGVFAAYSERTVPSARRCSPRWPQLPCRRCSAGVRRWAGASGAPSSAGAAVAPARAGPGRAAHVGGPDRRAGLGRPGPRRPPAGHEGAQRLGPGRLPDVALPAPRPGHARVRRHLHHRRARPEQRLPAASRRAGSTTCAPPEPGSPCCGPGHDWPTRCSTDADWTVVHTSRVLVMLRAPRGWRSPAPAVAGSGLP